MDIFDIALTLTPRIGPNTAQLLMREFGSAESLFNTPLREIIERTQLNEGIAKLIVDRVAMKSAEEEIQHCLRNKIKIMASTDAEYPPLLLECYDPPHVIYVMGNEEVLQGRNISFVGTRKNSAYGERVTIQLIESLAKTLPNCSIISGIAYGIDGIAHRAALNAGLPTAAVLPCSLPDISPAQHRQLAYEILSNGGALVSEYASSTKTNGRTFIARNRIVAALSFATVVVESDDKGGSLSTARLARDCNRAVFAVPGRITDATSRGCNQLISQQIASPCLSAKSILYEMGWEATPQTESSSSSEDQLPKGVSMEMLSEDHLKIIRCFSSGDPLHISAIEAMSGLPISKINGLLIELELLEIISTPKGACYELLVAFSIFDKDE